MCFYYIKNKKIQNAASLFASDARSVFDAYECKCNFYRSFLREGISRNLANAYFIIYKALSPTKRAFHGNLHLVTGYKSVYFIDPVRSTSNINRAFEPYVS